MIQRLVDQVLGDLPFCFISVDDILIFSKDLSSHVDHLLEVFILCRKHGLTIGLPKCKFAVSKIEFLDHLLSATGCSLLSKHSVAISAFPPPSDKPALQRFLGMINFYGKFLLGAARVLAPSHMLLKGMGKSLLGLRLLTPPSPEPRIFSLPFLSSFILNLMLPSLSLWMLLTLTWVQLLDGSWAPLAFYSKKLSDVEKKSLPLTVNCSLLTLLFATSDSCLKVKSLLFSWITNL